MNVIGQNITDTNGSMFCRMTKRLLGHILVDGEFISSQDLKDALSRQEETNIQLGEILVRMGLLNFSHLQMVLSVQKNLSSLQDAVKVAAGVRQLLGELLIQARRLTRQQLNHALAEQKRTGEKLGAILIRHGLINDKELSAILKFQKNQVSRPSGFQPFRLGEILVSNQYITRDQLEDALRKQRLSHKKIGEVLVEAGYLTKKQVSSGLRIQNMFITAVLAAILSLASTPNGNVAHAGSSSAKVTISARVMAYSQLKVLYQLPEITITMTDIKRGYIDINAASRLQVKNNSPKGYLLAFQGIAQPFKEIHIKGMGNDLSLSSAGGFVLRPYIKGNDTVELSYRFVLSENAQPGTYAWPVNVSVQPS